MEWLFELQRNNPPAHAIGIIALVCVAGMSLGSIQVRGIKLGTAGVLFAAIVVGSFGEPVDHHTLEFIKEFGLILFVFCIGLQIGPGFFASIRQSGLRLNAIAGPLDRHLGERPFFLAEALAAEVVMPQQTAFLFL